jgi:hypothetical protein
MYPAVNGNRELVEILFPKTRPVPSLPDWSVDGIIRSIAYPFFKPQVTISIVSCVHGSLSQAWCSSILLTVAFMMLEPH